ncbi:hypothetical protein H072_5991 [Dactylellina haptotyla CBS 200.50]|uniref:C2H2-type domain-containing protein n=1 Tax=Dactylellina haptotyla (strain CBS 200.50) TaxID=1284197 RepID=S8BLA4_DACHA|nr:hypothetical protein H072_5991 [Dactylellina haptotyla CBS 200.50]
MTEVMYPVAFSQDYAYLAMPKRRTSNYELPHTSVEAAGEYNLLDETHLFKQDAPYMTTPRTSQETFQLELTYDDDNLQYHPYSGVATDTIPAGYSESFMPSPEHSLHGYSGNSYNMSVAMQQQLSQDQIPYYHTPVSPSVVSDSAVPTQSISDSSFNLSGALSSISYTHFQPHNETKPQPSDISMALQRTLSGGQITKPKRQFTSAREAVFTCQVPNCGKHFKRIWNYKAHQQTHNPERAKPFQCGFSCGKSFVRKTDRERHETCVHSKKKEFRCQLCNSMFARKDTLRRHEDDGCSKRTGFPKTKPKRRRSPVIPNREPNPSPIKSSPSSRCSSRKSSFVSRTPMEAQLLAQTRAYKLEQ